MSKSFFFPENRAFYEVNWKKYCTVGQAPGNNMAQAHCMPNT